MEDLINTVKEDPWSVIGVIAFTHATSWVTLKIIIGVEKFIRDYIWDRKPKNPAVVHNNTSYEKGEDNQDCVIYLLSPEDVEEGEVMRNKKEGNGIRHRTVSHKRKNNSSGNKCCQRSKDSHYDDSEDVSEIEISIDGEKSRKQRTRSRTTETRQSRAN